MNFSKVHVNGNDFVIVEGRPDRLNEETAKSIANRRRGVGCDQVLLVQRPSSEITSSVDSDSYGITIFNCDGSIAKMCGNGICAVAFCVTELGVGSKRQDTNITVSVCGTRYKVKVHGASVTAEFPSPELHEDGVISTGNKHVIMPMERLSEAASISRMYNECNIHFVSVVRDGEIRLKTFERGVGWTSACGSGAVASAFATIKKGMVKVTHTGGVSFVNALDDCVTLTVQPKVTFRGVWYESNIS